MNDLVQNILFVGIPAYIALGLSLFLLFRDLHLDRKRLDVQLTGIRVWNKDKISLVLFDLVLVNPARIGRTVVRVPLWTPLDIDCKLVQPVIDDNLQSVTFPLPNGKQTYPFAKDEVLLKSVDILPNQSQNVIVGYNLQWTYEDDPLFDALPKRFHISAHDLHGKRISKKLPLAISLKQLKQTGAIASVQLLTND